MVFHEIGELTDAGVFVEVVATVHVSDILLAMVRAVKRGHGILDTFKEVIACHAWFIRVDIIPEFVA